MSDDLDALRATFAPTNAELERLREAITVELGGVRTAAAGLHEEEVHRQAELIDELDSNVKQVGHNLVERLSVLSDTLTPLVRDATEMREVVEPLRTATERVGRLERLPGPGRTR